MRFNFYCIYSASHRKCAKSHRNRTSFALSFASTQSLRDTLLSLSPFSGRSARLIAIHTAYGTCSVSFNFPALHLHADCVFITIYFIDSMDSSFICHSLHSFVLCEKKSVVPPHLSSYSRIFKTIIHLFQMLLHFYRYCLSICHSACDMATHNDRMQTTGHCVLLLILTEWTIHAVNCATRKIIAGT